MKPITHLLLRLLSTRVSCKVRSAIASQAKAMKIILLLVLVAAATAKVDYDGHMVIRVVPENDLQLKYLLALQSEAYDFWSSPTSLDQEVDIRVSPNSYYHLARALASVGLSHQIYLSDIGSIVRDEERNILLRRALFESNRDTKAFDLENYHTYPEMETFLKDLSASNKLVSTSTIGTTYEGVLLLLD